MTDCLYRYDDIAYSLGVDSYNNPTPGYDLKLELRKFNIIKVTPKGVWIKLSEFSDKKRFVLLTSYKKFACETKEKALESYLARKSRQIRILKYQLERAEKAYELGIKLYNSKD